jgi:signal transduction histidine kinase
MTGRQALEGMWRLLAVVRAQGEQPLSPRPNLAQLDALAAQVREAGLPVHVLVEGLCRPLPPGVDLSVYRIIQEALTNTLKHAGPAAAQVVVRYGKEALELEISDDGCGADEALSDHLEEYGQGRGLIGMRERTALVGGHLEAGAQQGAGYRVMARLPA